MKFYTRNVWTDGTNSTIVLPSANNAPNFRAITDACSRFGSFRGVYKMNSLFGRSNKFAPAAFLGTLLFSAAPSHAQDLRIATEGYYAPFNYIDDAGELAGFDVDISNALCAIMEMTCEIVQNDWDVLIPGLTGNEYDAIIASMSITAERKELVDFTLPYYSNMLTFVGNKEGQLSVSNDGMSGRSVGALVNTVSSDYLNSNYADIVTVELYDTQNDALNALVAGEIDLVIGDNLPIYAWLQTDQGNDHEFIGEFIDINDRISIAVRQTDGDLLDKFNGALIEIIENGTYQEINAKYFPFSIYF
jgi:ABC-type amino acid transport substrate-binding protein